jgi:hypothetical protein
VKSRGSRILLAHAAVVLVLVVLFLVLEAGIDRATTGPTAAVGLLVPYLPLVVLGLPWSLAYWLDPYAYDDADRLTWLVVVLGPAMLNVGVHGLIRWVRGSARRVDAGT